jgi:hypothetical protein
MGKGSTRRPEDGAAMERNWPFPAKKAATCTHPNRMETDRVVDRFCGITYIDLRCPGCGLEWRRQYLPWEILDSFLDTSPE